MSELYYDFLFPSLVCYTENKDLVTESIVTRSLELIEQHNEKPFFSDCYSTVNKFGTVLELPEFSEIKQAIINALGGYCTMHKIQTEGLRFTCSWLNLYKKYGYQDLHSHPDSMISGVFYIKSSEESDFVFQAPWHFFQPSMPIYTEQNLKNSHNILYESKVGRCLIFPSHLMHRTLPATSERISLSFNIAYSQN
jgi:uncharacterized protein (TIGR02466 family)